MEIDDKLTWKFHVKTVEKKIAQSIGILSKIRYKINNKTAATLYNTLIHSRISYCNIVWANTYKSSLAHLLVLQKRALRVILKYRRKIGEKDLFQEANKLSVTDVAKLQMFKVIFDWHHNLLPKSFNTFLSARLKCMNTVLVSRLPTIFSLNLIEQTIGNFL